MDPPTPPTSSNPKLLRDGLLVGGCVVLIIVAIVVYIVVFKPLVYSHSNVSFTTVAPNLSPARYGLIPASYSNNGTTTLRSQTTSKFTLIPIQTSKLKIMEGDEFLVKDVSTNRYLCLNDCDAYADKKSCDEATFDSKIKTNTCVYNTSTSKCTKSSPNIAELGLRTLPSNYSSLTSPFSKAFRFSLIGVSNCAKTCTPSPTQLRTYTNYVLKSSLSSDYLIPNMTTLSVDHSNDPYTSNFNWQLLK